MPAGQPVGLADPRVQLAGVAELLPSDVADDRGAAARVPRHPRRRLRPVRRRRARRPARGRSRPRPTSRPSGPGPTIRPGSRSPASTDRQEAAAGRGIASNSLSSSAVASGATRRRTPAPDRGRPGTRPCRSRTARPRSRRGPGCARRPRARRAAASSCRAGSSPTAGWRGGRRAAARRPRAARARRTSSSPTNGKLTTSTQPGAGQGAADPAAQPLLAGQPATGRRRAGAPTAPGRSRRSGRPPRPGRRGRSGRGATAAASPPAASSSATSAADRPQVADDPVAARSAARPPAPGRSRPSAMAVGAGGVPTTVTPGATVPPPYVVSSSATRSAAASQMVGSTPRSLRLPASEVSLCRLPVRNIETGSQWAASITTVVVASDISVVSPPITPPRPIAPESSVTTRSSVDSARSTPSRVVQPLPRGRPAYDDRSLELVAVVAVDRLAELEHHVVGDVDRQRDRPHPGQPDPARPASPASGRSGRSR